MIKIMKYLPLALFFTIGTITLPATVSSANADQIKPLSTTTTPQYNQAATLTTEAATIGNRWGYGIEKTNNINQSASSISIIREDDCRKLDPGELLKDPGSFFRECPIIEKNQTPELGEKIEYFQVPKLDSGIKLQVTQF
jgi:hypothetical protein